MTKTELEPGEREESVSIADAISMALGLHRSGELARAEEIYRDILRVDPANADANHLLGLIELRAGNKELAERLVRQALETKPDYAQAHCSLGDIYRELEQPRQAITSYLQALKLLPDSAEALNNLGNAYADIEKYSQARDCYARALQIDPKLHAAYGNLASALNHLGNHERAIAIYRQLLAKRPGNELLMNNLANALAESHQHLEAAGLYEAVLATQADHVDVYTSLIRSLQALNDEQRTARQLQGEGGESAAPDARKLDIGDAIMVNLEGLLQRDELPALDKRKLVFAMGTVLDSNGEYDRAFECFTTGEAILPQEWSPTTETTAEDVAKIKASYESWQPPARASAAGITPVFVLGMSRSGKTSVERLLGQDERVFAAGELPGVWRDALETVCGHTGASLMIESLDPEHIRAIGEHYLGSIGKLAGGAGIVVNTNPFLSTEVGLLASALPEARFIHCIRDARDTSLFAYFRPYRNGNAYARTLGSALRYHALYQDLMAVWEKKLGSSLLRVQYETLVREPQQLAGRIYAHCGIDLAGKDVTGLLHDGEIGHWQHYAKYFPVAE